MREGEKRERERERGKFYNATEGERRSATKSESEEGSEGGREEGERRPSVGKVLILPSFCALLSPTVILSLSLTFLQFHFHTVCGN